MPTTRTVVACNLLLLCLLSAPVSATPISASMFLKADVQRNGDGSASMSDAQSWGVPLTPLSTSALAAAGGINAQGSGAATWGAAGDSGSVDFTDYGWSFVPDVAGSASLNDHSGGNDWSYKFLADATGMFTMNFSVVGSGTTFGLQGWDILWSGLGGDEFLTSSHIFDPTVSGVFTRPVVGGQV